MEETIELTFPDWFKPEHIDLAFVSKRGKHMQALWDSLSLDGRRLKMSNNLNSPEVRVRAQEHARDYWKSRTPEQIEAHIRSTFLTPEAIKKSGESYHRYYENLSKEEKESISKSSSKRVNEHYNSLEGDLTRDKLSKLARDKWASKTGEEKLEWLERSCRSNKNRESSGPNITRGLLKYWENITDGERELRLQSWLDSDAILNIVKSNKKGITEPERMARYYLDRLQPGRWLYNGDGGQGIRVGRCIPDFVRADGTKEVIEIFGRYWHKEGTDKDKIKYYKDNGYKCVVLWDYECYFEIDIVNKLESFSLVTSDLSSRGVY